MAVIRRGIGAHVQNLELFDDDVRENVLVSGQPARSRRSDGPRGARLRRDRRRQHPDPSAELAPRTRTLKRVEQRRARLRAEASVLDEPAGGSRTRRSLSWASSSAATREDFRLTVLLVEHHMNLVMGISDRVHVLDFGRKIAPGHRKRSSATRP